MLGKTTMIMMNVLSDSITIIAENMVKNAEKANFVWIVFVNAHMV